MNAKDIVKKVRAGNRGNSKNVTYRIPVDLLIAFEAACKKQGIKRGAVIQELIRDFLESLS